MSLMSANRRLSITANVVLTLCSSMQAALVKQAFQLEREIITLACKHKAPKPVS